MNQETKQNIKELLQKVIRKLIKEYGKVEAKKEILKFRNETSEILKPIYDEAIEENF